MHASDPKPVSDGRFVSPFELYPEAHREVFDTARTEEEAAEIFRRHGMSDQDAELCAGLLFEYNRHDLKAALPTPPVPPSVA